MTAVMICDATDDNRRMTGAGANSIAASDIHVILDELALLIQYCCMYSKYLKQLTDGAEKRLRSEASVTSDSLTRQHSSSGGNSIGAGGSPRMSPGKTLPSSSGGVAHGGGGVGGNATAVVVFDGPTDFDKMVDELVNRYYMEGASSPSLPPFLLHFSARSNPSTDLTLS